MQVMMNNMIHLRNEAIEREAQFREQEMLQRAIEESKNDIPQYFNTDHMTYEELLALEEENGGSVSKGLKPSQILKIPFSIYKPGRDGAKTT